jgi:hypothetical protein
MVPSRPDLSSEVLLRNRSDLRFCCAICAGDSDIARQCLESRKDRIDWMALIEIAKNYRLEMLLYRAANSHLAEFVSSSALEALHKLYVDNRARGLAMTAGLLRVLDRLASEQIPAMPFKGPALGAQFYGDIALRVYWDLDLLVRECDLAKVTTIMREQGYREAGMSLSWERSFVRESGESGESVDVHWSITEKIHQFPLTPDELWARRATIDLAGTSVPTLCAEDALLVICFNGLTEDWQRCDRIADVAEIMRASSAIDWPKFLDMCRRRGCERLVLVGLHLAKELFLVKLPQCAELRLQSHLKAIGRAGYAIDDFMAFVVTSTGRREGFDHWRHIFRMRERRWEKIPYYQSFAYSLFKPKDDDAPWQRASRQMLYQVARLPLLGAKHALKVLGHASLTERDNRP